jgi:tetratricopeptide (TPR) repeat protein/predicted Ser/Thr protein kinase
VSCPDDNTLVALIEHALDTVALSAVEAHVDSCESCRNVVAGLAIGSKRSFAFGTPGPAASRDSAEALVDARISDRYVVRSLLGRGGMGTVYLANDVTLGRDVAIKVHRAGTGNDRLHREAMAMAKLAHPNVVTVFEVGSVDDRMYVAMELIRGSTLRGWLADTPRSWREIVALLVEVGAGLAAAHAAGLVHRDFKPENVLVGDDGRPRVGDFGLAHLGPQATQNVVAPLDVDARATVTGTVLGTPAYMAPEQFDGTVDARSDQFAFCVVAWECLFGARPFAGRSLVEIQAAIERHEIARPAKTEVPERLRRAIERGLALDPEARYPDLASLLAALRDAAAPHRRRLVVAGIAAAVVAGLAVWGAFALQARRADAACVERGDEIRALFDAEARDGVQRAFAATGSPSAQSSFEHVAGVLGRYTESLAARTTEVCRGTDDPPRIAAARDACLDEHQRDLAAMVRGLAHARDAIAVQRAPDVAWAMYEPVPCSEVTPLLQAAQTSTDEAKRLHAIKLQHHTGDYATAVTASKQLLAEARANHNVNLEMQVLLQLGQLQMSQEKLDEAATAFQDLETLAETTGRDLDAAMALGQLAAIAGVDRHDYATAHRQLALAKAKLQRLGGKNLGMNADLLTIEGQILSDESKLPDAERALRQAVAFSEQAYGADNPKVVTSIGTLSQVLRSEGKLPESLDASRRTLAVIVQALGEEHPTAAGAQMNLASTLIMLKRYDEARDLLRHADAVFERVWGPDHPVRAALLGNLGGLEYEQQHYDAALVAYRKAVTVLERAAGPESADTAGARRDVARTLVAMGKYADALVESQQDVAILEKVGKDNPRLPGAQIQLAHIHLALGHPAVALPIAERGLANELAQGTDADRDELATGRFVLARALWDTNGDRARARSLAEQAVEGQDDGGTRAEIARWLETHSLAQARR